MKMSIKVPFKPPTGSRNTRLIGEGFLKMEPKSKIYIYQLKRKKEEIVKEDKIRIYFVCN